MILADTSVWVDHLRKGEPALSHLLEGNRVCIHPFVIGEVALGSLKSRKAIIELLQALPHLPVASPEEALFFIDRNRLMSRGVGLVDVHLLASVALGTDARLWTRDKHLCAIAAELGLGWLEPTH